MLSVMLSCYAAIKLSIVAPNKLACFSKLALLYCNIYGEAEHSEARAKNREERKYLMLANTLVYWE